MKDHFLSIVCVCVCVCDWDDVLLEECVFASRTSIRALARSGALSASGLARVVCAALPRPDHPRMQLV